MCFTFVPPLSSFRSDLESFQPFLGFFDFFFESRFWQKFWFESDNIELESELKSLLELKMLAFLFLFSCNSKALLIKVFENTKSGQKQMSVSQ